MEEKALISLNNEILLNQVKDLLKENGIAYIRIIMKNTICK